MKIAVALGDVVNFETDVLILKCADQFRGADASVAQAIGFAEVVPKGEYRLATPRNFPAKIVVFLGVGSLAEFRYSEIQEFGRRLIRVYLENNFGMGGLFSVATTSHGGGYGLDEREAFRNLVAGLLQTAKANEHAHTSVPGSVTIVERNERRQSIFSEILPDALRQASVEATSLDGISKESERKPKLFAAMPFEEACYDEYSIAFVEAAEKSGFLCERLDLATYVGDVISEIKNRIAASSGVVALMNGHNANVFLEIGYAWAKEKPAILVIKRGEKPPFDVRSHRYIDYGSISELRQRLTTEIAELKKVGVLR